MATIQRIPVSGDGTVAVPSEWFIARITSVAASQSGSASCLGYAHGWIEQSICANGFSYEDDPEGQSGTTTVDPAFALDGTQASVDDIVLMRPRSIGANDLTVFEFFKGGGGAQWYSGSGEPSNTIGKDGDFFQDTTNGNTYIKIDGSWVLIPKNSLDCPHVTSVQCTGGMLVVTYDTTCVGV